ncbi:MAG: glycerol-3-phosphate dehydrogenase/oxidase [Deltaproteobacteria bacterium]|nr:glycerol-3-phosphate dehydrogenase/oxidase [Deltaproteobacteria bacterium]
METRWTAKDRREHIARAKGRAFDLVIIGGGITGAGVAREAALRGLSFCLVDKNDFAFGTSSRSSKLCHGGLRYLSQGKLGLVRESTTERNWLRHVLPHLVRPLGFMYCTYERGKDHALAIRAALHLYDALSDGFSAHKTNRRAEFFTPAEVAEIEPAVTQHDPDLGSMTMGGLYYDTNVDDGRLTLETLKESLALGGDRAVAVSYARGAGTLKDGGCVTGVRALDALGNDDFEVRGRVVVSCTGIWSDEVMALTDLGQQRIYPTKGVHVVVPNDRLGNRNAFGIRSFDDGRFYFVLRRGPVSVIGTTDTDYYQESRNLDEPWCTREDCDYLLRSVNRLFPRAALTYRGVISTYAGVRPLIKEPGSKHESAVSREHAIYASPDGVVAIAGGKMTTYRKMGEDLLFYLVEHHHLPPFASARDRRRGLSLMPFRVGVTWDEFSRPVAAREDGLRQLARLLLEQELERVRVDLPQQVAGADMPQIVLVSLQRLQERQGEVHVRAVGVAEVVVRGARLDAPHDRVVAGVLRGGRVVPPERVDVDRVVVDLRHRAAVDVDLGEPLKVAVRAARVDPGRGIHAQRLQLAAVDQHVGEVVGRVPAVPVDAAERQGLIGGDGLEGLVEPHDGAAVVDEDDLVHLEDEEREQLLRPLGSDPPLRQVQLVVGVQDLIEPPERDRVLVRLEAERDVQEQHALQGLVERACRVPGNVGADLGHLLELAAAHRIALAPAQARELLGVSLSERRQAWAATRFAVKLPTSSSPG